MKRLFAKLSVDKQLHSMLVVGFVGFLVYFAVILVISTQNEKTMTSVVEEKIPSIEAIDGLASALTGVQDVVAQNGISVGMEGIASLEGANGKVIEAFNRIEKTKGFSDEEKVEITAIKKKYTAAYAVLADSLNGVVAGLDTLSSVQTKIQRNNLEVSSVGLWASDLKNLKNSDLRASIEAANLGSNRLVFAGIVMIVAGIPFAMLF